MLHQSVPASIRVALDLDGTRRVDYRGEYGLIPEVTVRSSGLAPARAAKLENALRRHFGGAVEFADDAECRVFVGRAEKIPFAGLAETQGKGGNAFVNLDAAASDRELFEVAAHEIGHLVGTVSHDGEGLAAVAYTGGAANITLSTGTLNGSAIANETYVADEPYAQSVGITGEAAVTNCSVVSGGILYIDNGANAVQNGDLIIGSNGVVRVRSKALVDGVTMNGGTLSAWAGTVSNLDAVNAQEILINGTLLSNGTVTGGRLYTQYAAKLNNVTFRDGAVGSMVSGSIDSTIKAYGATVIVSSAAKVYGLDSDENATITVLAGGSLTVSSGDNATNVTLNRDAVHAAQAGATLTNYTLNGFYNGNLGLQVSSGITLNGATMNNDGTSKSIIRFYAGATGANIVMTGGDNFTTIDGSGTVVDGVQLIAGGSAEVRTGALAKNVTVSGAGVRLRIASATVDGATIDGYEGAVGSAALTAGGTLKNAQILSSGAVYVNSGAAVSGVTANANALLYIYAGASAQDITVANNNRTFIAGGVTVDKLTVLTGGSLLLSGAVTINDLQMNGGFVSSAAAVTGAITGGHIQGGAKLWIRPGLTVDTLSATGANTLLTTFEGNMANIYASDGATVNVNHAVMDSSLIDTGAILIVSNNGKVSNTDIRSTTATIVNGSAVNIRVSGGTMDIQAGGQVSSAVISGATVDVQSLGRISGLTAQKDAVVNLSSGGIIYGINGEAGAQVNIYTGGSGNILAGDSAAGVFIKAGGTAFVGGGIIYGVSATDAEKGMLRVSAGASALGGKLTGATFTMVASGESAYMSGFEFGSGVYAYVRTGALVDDTAILAGGQIHLQGGDTNKITVSNGGIMTVSTGATATSTTLYTGATHNALAGAVLVDYKDYGYELKISSGVTLNGALITGSDTARGTLRFYNGATGADVVASGSAFVTVNGATALVDGLEIVAGGSAEIRESSTVRNAVVSAAGLQFKVYQSATLTGATINGYGGAVGSAWVSGGASINSVTVLESGIIDVKDDAAATAVRVLGGTALVSGTVDGAEVIGAGLLNVKAGATATGIVVSGASAFVSGTAQDITVTDSAGTKGFFRLYAGATLTSGLVSGTALFTADAENTLASGLTVRGGGEVNIRNAADAKDMNVIDGRAYADNSNTRLDTATVGGGSFGYLGIRTGASATSVTVISGGAVNVTDATLDGATVSAAGALYLTSGATLNGGTVSSGGALGVFGGARANGVVADADATLDLNLSGATVATPLFDTLAGVDAAIRIGSETLGTEYAIADTGNTAARFVVDYQLFDTEIGVGEYVNPFWKGRKYTVGAGGTTFKVEEYTMSDTILTTEAADLATSGAVINGGDKALYWADVAMATGSAVTFATGAINGDAWLDLNRTQMDAKATVYGAEGNFGGTIRYLVHGTGGTLGNFAAGATSNGTVGNVELVSYNNTYNLTYLGGMGNVTGHVSAAISSGNTLAKDFYAGALANYAKTQQATNIGSINATIALRNDNDRVRGNIYGASAVKAGDISVSTTAHTVGDVTLTLTGGTADRSDICVFAAGYATGHDTAKALPVYTVGSVTATISGGSWGGARGGRGIFGGAMASDNLGSDGVWAQVGDVDLTISGGTMGNVFGGGWAQKGAKSQVGNVSITVTGGTIANIFGGGSTSSSGGETYADDVTITVSGGTITGDIYARGQLATDHVNGTAEVVFTGSAGFSCGVYGYSYVGGEEASNATLSCRDYTGTFSGKVGGFTGITFDGDTAMTLTTSAADVSNAAWIFDAADRGLTDTAFLDWDAADFTGDTITLNLATGDANAWTLVDAAAETNYGTFTLQVDRTDVATGLGLGEAIDGGAYDGWGFTLDGTALKFAKLA